MPDDADALRAALRQPFPERVAYFRGKLGKLVPTERWDDIAREQHDTAFMVAGAQKADLLADLAAAVDRAIAEGKGIETFRRDFNAAVERHNWHGWTGEGTKAGRAWRTRTIYRTNLAVSYAAGRRAQLEAKGFPYWIYRHGGSRDPRPEHLSWDGLVLPPDHPFWTTHYPPSDWGCSCKVVGEHKLSLARLNGGDPDKKLPGNWRDVDPRTGAPVGIGKGWDYAPGAGVSRTVAALAGRIGRWDYQIAKAFMQELPPAARDAISDAYRRLPSVADDARRFAARTIDQRDPVRGPTAERMTLGMLTKRDVDAIDAASAGAIAVDGYDFSIAVDSIQHVARRHGDPAEARRGQKQIEAEDYALLPEIVQSPDAIEHPAATPRGEKLIQYVKRIGKRRYVVVFAVSGARRRTLQLKTMYVQGT